jgi:hypothetical protein
MDSVAITNTCILPVELNSFEAECNNDFTELKWETASEKNNDYFLLERADANMKFETIATIKGNGNSNQKNQYNYKDYTNAVENYYQLIQVDFDGKRTNSKLIYFKNTCIQDFKLNQLFYNNSANQIHIKYFTERETPVSIQLYDLFGRLISSEILMFYNGNNEVKINTNQLTNAMYICTVSSENFREVKKIIVNSK